MASEFVADWKRLQKNALVRCQTDLDPISSKGIYQAVDLANVKTFVPSYDRNRGSFVAAYKKEIDIEGIWRSNLAKAYDEGLINESVKALLDQQFKVFRDEYRAAIDAFFETGAVSYTHLTLPTICSV